MLADTGQKTDRIPVAPDGVHSDIVLPDIRIDYHKTGTPGQDERACCLHYTDSKPSWLLEQFESGIFV